MDLQWGRKTVQIRRNFITLWSWLVLRTKKTVISLWKSHAASSSPLFNGPIAVPTPSCLRALFPYGYCTIRYFCRCLADINAYFPCQPSKLNRIGGGERKNGGLNDRWPTKKARQSERGRLSNKLKELLVFVRLELWTLMQVSLYCTFIVHLSFVW